MPLKQKIAQAENILGHGFANRALLEEALTHPSVEGAAHYQRLEFLGDRVLGLIIARWLFESFPSEAEGRLNRRFSALVRKETLAEIALQSGLQDFIRLETGTEAEGGRTAPTVLADVCEAVIGALYLDAGLPAAEQFIERYWRARLSHSPGVERDAKTALQEWAQARKLPLPKYRLIARSGPDHDPDFEIEVSVLNQIPVRAHGHSKRSAEQVAAEKLLAAIKEKGNSR